MANISVVKLKVRRGTDAQRRQIVFDQGEFAFTVDTGRIFIGDGATPGGLSPAMKYYTINSSSYTTLAQTTNYIQQGDLVYDTNTGNYYTFTGTDNTDITNYTFQPIVTPNNIGSLGGAVISNAVTAYLSQSPLTLTAGLSSGADIKVKNLVVGTSGPSSNAAFGDSVLGHGNNVGSYNTALGNYSLFTNVSGSCNTASGYGSLFNNSCGNSNTATGFLSQYSNTNGSCNTASGYRALYNNVYGNNNTAVGSNALYNVNVGGNNVGIGQGALKNVTSGFNNAGLGVNSGADSMCNITTQNNIVVVGNGDTQAVLAKVNLTVLSDKRDKTQISPVPYGLDFVSKLQPVSFKFKKDRSTDDIVDEKTRFGFLAQDIVDIEETPPVIVDTSDSEKLKINEAFLIPVLVNAIKQLTERVQELEAKLNN
jgi:hypothetical protein